MQFLKNPLYIYSFSFLSVTIVYLFRWSDLYPNLGVSLIIFLFISSIIALSVGGIVDKYKPIRYKLIKKTKYIAIIIIFIYFLYFLEFIYNKGIPIVLIFTTDWYDYTKFGVKTLHPILTTFTSFYTVYLFHLFLSNKTKKNLLYLLLLMAIPILIYNRGMFLINLVSMLFVFFMSVKKIKKKVKFYIFISILIVIYFFGILGNYRMTKTISNDYFLEVSQATSKFKKSIIPKEFMWTYIYISSPLGNLQNTIQNNPKINYRFKDFIFTELFPDFLSKRISSIVNVQRVEKINRLTTFITVGTIYSRSYILLGWLGIIIMYIFLVIMTFLYILVIPSNSQYYITGISILCSFMFFNTFTNMIYFSGLSFQLVYPLVLSFFTLKIRAHD